MEPLSEADRYLSVIRILLQSLMEVVDDPETHIPPERAAAFERELRVADAMLGRVA